MKVACFALLVILLLGISCDAVSPFRSYKLKNCCKATHTEKKLKLEKIISYSTCQQQFYNVNIKGKGILCFKITKSMTEILQAFDAQQKNGKN